MKTRILIMLVAMMPVLAVAQSKKDIKKYGIKNCTEWVTKNENGKEISYKESFKAFDKNGYTIEQIEYYKDGRIKRKENYRFDKDGNVIEETLYESKENKAGESTVTKKVAYKYNINSDKTEEVEYDGGGNVVKKTAYVYNANGDRTTEMIYDAGGKLLKKVHYTYDSRGLKTEKKVLRPDNSIDSIKKYVYGF